MKFEPLIQDFVNPNGFRSCLNCSYCCTVGPCMIAANKYGDKWTSPCPSLRSVKGPGGEQFLCGEVLDAKTPEEKERIFRMIGGVGDDSGCSSPMFNEQRDIIRKSLIASDKI